MKKLILLMTIAIALQAKQPVAIPQVTQIYPGMTGDQAFNSMVRAAGDYRITVAVKEACMIQFTSRHEVPGPIFYWTMRCDVREGGVVILFKAITQGAGLEFNRMQREDQEYVRGVVEAAWHYIQFDLCKSGCDKSPIASK